MKKYVMFTIGGILSLIGFSAFVATLAELAADPDPGASSSDYALVTVFFVVLPFVCGIALCVFATRKWLKKWWNSRRDKKKHFGTEISEEKPVDPATAVLNRRVNGIANVSTIVTVIIGIVVVLKLSNWFAGLIGIPSAWVLPIFILPIVVGAMLGRIFIKKFLVNKSIEFLKRMSEYKR